MFERGTARLLQIDEIDDEMIRAQMRLDFVPRHAARANNDDLSLGDALAQVADQKRANVGNGMFDVFAVGADQASEGNIVIPDFKLSPFSKQVLDKLNLRALAKIVSRRLETQPKNGNLS